MRVIELEMSPWDFLKEKGGDKLYVLRGRIWIYREHAIDRNGVDVVTTSNRDEWSECFGK